MTHFRKIRPLQSGDPMVNQRGAALPAFALLWQQLFSNGETTERTANAALASAIDTNAEAERVRDVIGAALVAGANISISVNDSGDTITIAATGTGGGSAAFDGGSASIGGRGFVLDGGDSAPRSDLDYWIDGGSA